MRKTTKAKAKAKAKPKTGSARPDDPEPKSSSKARKATTIKDNALTSAKERDHSQFAVDTKSAKKEFAKTTPRGARALTSSKTTTGYDGYGQSLPSETAVSDEAITIASSYAEVLPIDFRAYTFMQLSMHNTGANALLYQVWGSLKAGSSAPAFSDDSWTQLAIEGSIVAGQDGYETLSERWRWLTVRMVQSGGATSAKAYARLIK